MKKIIWNSNELKNIRQIILRKTNLKLTEDNQLKLDNKNLDIQDDTNLTTNMYLNFQQEFIDLFYFQDKVKIREILTKASLVNADKDNRLHHGLIMNLSKINPDNKEEIFQIYKDVIGHYEHVISIIANKMISNINDENVIREKIEYLKNTTELTVEEKLVINHLNKTFTFTNGVCDDEMLQPLIMKLNSLIKTRLIYKYNLFLTREVKNKKKLAQKEYNEIKQANQNKYLRSRRYKNKAYGIRVYE